MSLTVTRPSAGFCLNHVLIKLRCIFYLNVLSQSKQFHPLSVNSRVKRLTKKWNLKSFNGLSFVVRSRIAFENDILLIVFVYAQYRIEKKYFRCLVYVFYLQNKESFFCLPSLRLLWFAFLIEVRLPLGHPLQFVQIEIINCV